MADQSLDETQLYIINPRYAENLILKATIDGDCFLCQLTPSQVYANIKGYGKAHRYIWEWHNGLIPPGLFICHSCDRPRCINIHHLFIGTAQDNMTDKVNKNRQSRGGPGRLLSNVEIAEARELYFKGYTYSEIGDEFNVSRRTIQRYLDLEE